ncbi:Transcription factor S [uncultured archaeon]|nr:Transcription factor S [uncultured archaeon]
MLFCPKCKSIMMPKLVDGKKQLVCGCGYKHIAESVTITEKNKQKAQEISVVEKEEVMNPVVDAECVKCGNRKAEYWEVQTRAADEPATRFHKCTKCGHIWREYK